MKQKQSQNLYLSINDLFADLKYVEQQFLTELNHQIGMKDTLLVQRYMYRSIHEATMSLSSNLSSTINIQSQNQMKAIAEKLRVDDEAHQLLKAELSKTISNNEEKIQQLESKKIALSSELIGLEQRLLMKDEEVDRLKVSSSSRDMDFLKKLEESQSKQK